MQRFGDRRHCNKAAQLESLCELDFDRAILLDTDMIVLADVRQTAPAGKFGGNVVHYPNPSTEALEEIARNAGLSSLPRIISADAGNGVTYECNCNGGFYVIPKTYFRTVSQEWKRWILWLLEHNEPLRREGKQIHTDQVAMWLTIHSNAIPFEPLPANINYFIHVEGGHQTFDPDLPIAVLHYHNAVNVTGLIEAPVPVTAEAAEAIAQANRQIGENFNNQVFWDFRYSQFPERGSGVGSRGENIRLKRSVLKSLKVEGAKCVLDVGCGDLEVLKPLRLKKYLGLDESEEAIRMASAARPDWKFRLFDVLRPAENLEPYDTVLCFEVAIHQKTAEDYFRLIEFLASKTKRQLIVSGYEGAQQKNANNQFLYFHEPLSMSLERTKRFRSIDVAGAHTGVTILHCQV